MTFQVNGGGTPAALAIGNEFAIPDGVCLASIDSIDGTSWQLFLHPVSRNMKPGRALERLSRAADGTNPFFDPRIVIAGLDRVQSRKVDILVVWEILGGFPNARLLLPVSQAGGYPSAPAHLRSATHVFGPLGNPLMEDHDAAEKRLRLAQLLALAFANGFPPLVMEDTTSAQPGATLFTGEDVSGFVRIPVYEASRAALLSPYHPDSKRRREFRRLRGKLEQRGTVTLERATTPLDVLARFEEFLLLETRSWKGRKGTSLQLLKKTAAFARQSVYEMALAGRCEIYTLRLEENSVAALVLFCVNGWYYPWKIAFAEEHKDASPGLILVDMVSEILTSRRDFKGADSLASPGRSWISLLWKQNLELVTCVLAGDEGQAEAIAASMRRKRRSLDLVKRILRRS